MRFSDQFLDELRSRLSILEIAGKHVSWDPRKSRPAAGEYWACCPFHSEKTPSFHIKEHEGFFKCFSCEAGGGTIQFYQKIYNASFPEAVEKLADIAGLPLPVSTPEDRKKADKADKLIAMAEEAAKFFRLQLESSSGRAAVDYLRSRRLSIEDCRRYGIGYAPPGGALLNHLANLGYDRDLALEAGLAGKSAERGDYFDWFRNRIVFPIRSQRGKAIAFGGRAMDPNAKAKYLNSPETAIFKKGRCLYNHSAAREARARGKPLVLAEGYMDVIALCQAGFEASVAPLGTAVTADQLKLLWKLSPEPIVALDGDNAGFSAAIRVIYSALPLLGHSRSLRFCLLPEGLDPDDLISRRGVEAMKRLIDESLPLHRMLWLGETRERQFASPEKRAALQAKLNSAIEKIPDGNLRKQYFTEFKRMMWEAFSKSKGRRKLSGGAAGASAMPLNETKISIPALIAANKAEHDGLREAAILGIFLSNPVLIQEFESKLEEMTPSTSDHAEIIAALLDCADIRDLEEFKAAVAAKAGENKIQRLLSQRNVMIVPAIAKPGDMNLARAALEVEIQTLFAERSARETIKEARLDFSEDAGFSIKCIKDAKEKLEDAKQGAGSGGESAWTTAPVDENDQKKINAILARN